MSTIKGPCIRPRRNIKHLDNSPASVLVLTMLIAVPLAVGQMPFAQAQTIEEDNQEAQEPAGTVNTTQTVTAGNETIEGNGNFVREDADESLENLSTLSVTSISTTEVRPDRLSVSVGVETNGTTAQEAVSQNANLTVQVLTALRGLGITEDRI